MTDGNLYIGPVTAPDKYRLRRQVGGGGEALLWEADLEIAGIWEPVAVKVLRVERSSDIDEWGRRWAEQAEVLRFIRHPGVVGVREHFTGGAMHYRGEAAGSAAALYLVMNWVEGLTLRDWLARTTATRSLDQKLLVLAQIADVLDWLHSGQATPSGRPVVHADVTANNVIVNPSGQAVLIDFGLTRLAAGLSPSVEGTGGYLAPEVKVAGAYSPASDRYAFGALTYVALVGGVAPNSLAELRSGMQQALGHPARCAALDGAMRMFDPDPSRRPLCGAWIRSLRGDESTYAEAVPSSAPATTHAPRRRSRAALVALVAAAVLAIGAGVFAGLRLFSNADAATATTGASDTTSVTTDTVDTTAPETSAVPATDPQPDDNVLPCQPVCIGGHFEKGQFAGKNMTGFDLTSAQFDGADLEGAYLIRTKLVNADLRDARLNGAHLNGADLNGVDLRGTRLDAADLTDAIHFDYASVFGATTTGATMPNGEPFEPTIPERVKEAQVYANVLGIPGTLHVPTPIDEDGQLGPSTASVMRDFQQRFGITPQYGQVDRPTLDALRAAAYQNAFSGQWFGSSDGANGAATATSITFDDQFGAVFDFGQCSGISIEPSVLKGMTLKVRVSLSRCSSLQAGIAGTIELTRVAEDQAIWTFTSSDGSVTINGSSTRIVSVGEGG